MPTEDEIRNRFKHHPPLGLAVELHEEIRAKFTDLAVRLNEMLPESREKSLALTDLQSAAQWANATVAIHVSGAVEPVVGHVAESVRDRAVEMTKQHPTEHVVVLDQGGWTIMHSSNCRETGNLIGCMFTTAARETDFTGWDSPAYAVIRQDEDDFWLEMKAL
jgi:hypothetical protein